MQPYSSTLVSDETDGTTGISSLDSGAESGFPEWKVLDGRGKDFLKVFNSLSADFIPEEVALCRLLHEVLT